VAVVERFRLFHDVIFACRPVNVTKPERVIALYVMWPSGGNLPPKLRVFIDYLHQHLHI
jgi:DNA-binding transcriptional LysR family regulator